MESKNAKRKEEYGKVILEVTRTQELIIAAAIDLLWVHMQEEKNGMLVFDMAGSFGVEEKALLAATADVMIALDGNAPYEGTQVNCHLCNKFHMIYTKVGDIEHWQEGGLIQRVMPYLKPEERELLISQTCKSCFDKLFTSLN